MRSPDGYPGFTSHEAMTFAQLDPGDELIVERGPLSGVEVTRVNILDISAKGLRARWESEISAKMVEALDYMAEELRDMDKLPSVRAFLGPRTPKRAEPTTVIDQGLIVGCLRINRKPLRSVEELGVIAVSTNDTEYRFLCEGVVNIDTGQLQAGGERHWLWPIQALYHKRQ